MLSFLSIIFLSFLFLLFFFIRKQASPITAIYTESCFHAKFNTSFLACLGSAENIKVNFLAVFSCNVLLKENMRPIHLVSSILQLPLKTGNFHRENHVTDLPSFNSTADFGYFTPLTIKVFSLRLPDVETISNFFRNPFLSFSSRAFKTPIASGVKNGILNGRDIFGSNDKIASGAEKNCPERANGMCHKTM